MADTSPHHTNLQRGRHGRPHQATARPPNTSAALLLDTDVAERRCWRCLHTFRRDSTRAPTVTPEWWLCDPCDRILLPATLRAA
jgi:hypothetical protein